MNVWLLSVVALYFWVLMILMPFSPIRRPTLRWPTFTPNSCSSSVIRGRPLSGHCYAIPCRAVHSFAGFSDAVHGYELGSPYHPLPPLTHTAYVLPATGRRLRHAKGALTARRNLPRGALPLAHRTHPPRAVAARSYLHNAAQKRDWPFFLPGVPSHRNYISIAGQWRKASLTRGPLSHMLGMCCRHRDCEFARKP